MLSWQNKSLQQAITKLTKTMLNVSTLRANDQQQSFRPLVNSSIDYSWLIMSQQLLKTFSDGQCHWSADDILAAEEHPEYSNPRDSEFHIRRVRWPVWWLSEVRNNNRFSPIRGAMFTSRWHQWWYVSNPTVCHRTFNQLIKILQCLADSDLCGILRCKLRDSMVNDCKILVHWTLCNFSGPLYSNYLLWINLAVNTRHRSRNESSRREGRGILQTLQLILPLEPFSHLHCTGTTVQKKSFTLITLPFH